MVEAAGKQDTASPCAACKMLRRRCAQDCVFAPHFPADEPLKFANVHKVFGASNVSKLLQVPLYDSNFVHFVVLICTFEFANLPQSTQIAPKLQTKFK